MSTVVIILLVAFAAVLYGYLRALQALQSKQQTLNGMAAMLEAQERETEQYRRILARTTGGVGKRISERREIAEIIQKHAPDLFAKERGLIYWLEATDQFLVEWHDAAGADPGQERIASSRSIEIYRQVHAAMGLPLPTRKAAQ